MSEELRIAEPDSAGADPQAFERLVLKYQDRIYTLALRMVSDAEVARDLAQEAFIRAFQGLREFRQESSFYTWIHRITVNLCLSERRKKRVRTRIGILSMFDLGRRSADDEGASDPLPDEGEGPEEVLDAQERDEAVRLAIDSLEDDLRDVIVLRDMEGLAYEDVASQLEIPIGTVRSRIHRARELLRHRLLRWVEASA